MPNKSTDTTNEDGILRVVVNKDACMGARECSTLWAPETFDYDPVSGTAFILRDTYSREEVIAAARGCPNFRDLSIRGRGQRHSLVPIDENQHFAGEEWGDHLQRWSYRRSRSGISPIFAWS